MMRLIYQRNITNLDTRPLDTSITRLPYLPTGITDIAALVARYGMDTGININTHAVRKTLPVGHKKGGVFMSGYIEEKIIEIEKRAEHLLKQHNPEGHTLDQEYRWILSCTDAIDIEVKKLGKQSKALMEIKYLVDQGGESAFLVKGIKKILDDTYGL